MAGTFLPQNTASFSASQHASIARDHRHEDYRRAVITARQCQRTVSVQSWYGVNPQTCSMHETTVNCGAAALTSPCPTGQTVTNTVPTSTSPMTAPGFPTQHTGSHGLSSGVIALVVVFGTIIGVIVLIFLFIRGSRYWGKRPLNEMARGHGRLELRRRHAPKPSTSTVESGTSTIRPGPVTNEAQFNRPRRPSPVIQSPPPRVRFSLDDARPPGAWPIRDEDEVIILDRPPRTHPPRNAYRPDDPSRERRARERYEQVQREVLQRQRQVMSDRDVALDLQQEGEDRQRIVVEEERPREVHRLWGQPARSSNFDYIVRERQLASDVQMEERDRHDSELGHDLPEGVQRGGNQPLCEPENYLPDGVRRGGNQPVRELVHIDREIERIGNPHPLLPAEKDVRLCRSEADRRRRSVQGTEGRPFRPSQHHIRDPVGLRPPPPVAGRQRGYRRYEPPTVEDGDSLL